MARIFDWTNDSLQELFKFKTLQHISDNLYIWLPVATAAANAVDTFLTSTEAKFGSGSSSSEKTINNEKDEKSLQLDVAFRTITLCILDIPMLCFGSFATFYRGQSQNVISTMMNTKDTSLVETLSRELSVVSGRLSTSRDFMKALVLASTATNVWFTMVNWYKGRTGWFRWNLRKVTLASNLMLFYLLAKPVDVQIR
jgi:hypothetical protein